jgi:starvation-inducible DNA-binding protein
VLIHNDGHHSNLQVMLQPNIGLDSAVRRAVVEILNHTLANEAILTAKTRSAHWNMSGADFNVLFALFDSQYKQLNDILDKIAERVRLLGGIAIGSLQEFIKLTHIAEQPASVPDIRRLLAGDHEASIRFLSDDARKCTEEYQDEGTCELLVSILRLHEKMAWILRSYVEPELSHDEKKMA